MKNFQRDWADLKKKSKNKPSQLELLMSQIALINVSLDKFCKAVEAFTKIKVEQK